MSNKKFKTPTIYTRLKDVFNENENKITEDFESMIENTNSNKNSYQNKLNKKNNEKKEIYVNKPLINSFINSLQKNQKEIPNFKECINKIQKEFNFSDSLNNKNNSLLKKKNLIINNENFIQMAEEKIKDLKEKYKFSKEMEKTKKNVDKISMNSIQTKKKKIELFKTFNQFEFKKFNKRFKILQLNILLAKYNDVSIDDFLNNNPFNSKPFQLPNSIEFLDAVKYNKIKIVESFLNNKNYLYVYDYYKQTAFHWCVKRNYSEMIELLLSVKKACNQLDINNCTPLAIAAKNNNFNMIQILMNNNANPLIPDDQGKLPCDLTTDIKCRLLLIANENKKLNKWLSKNFEE